MSEDDIWEFYSRLFDAENSSSSDSAPLISEYDPKRYLNEEILTDLDPYKASNIIDEDEPVAVADNQIKGLEIEVYENRRDSFLEIPRQLFGDLDDFILHVDYFPDEDSTMIENANSLFLSGRYFTFNEEERQEVESYLNEFSEESFNKYIRASDLE